MGYIAFVLDEQSRSEVLSKLNPTHAIVLAHHITLSYDMERSVGLEVADSFATLIDTVEIVALIELPDTDMAVVAINDITVRDCDGFFHILLSTDNKRKEKVQSLGDYPYKKVTPIPLAGSVQYFDR